MKTATAPLPPLRSVKVLDQLRERIRYLHYSLRTEQAYVHWVRAFIRFHGIDKNFLFVAWSIFSSLLYVKKILATRYRRWMS